MKYVFHPEALAEYAEVVQYYAEQRSEVAQMFINAIEVNVWNCAQLEMKPTIRKLLEK